jgi:penicillin-binding protein 1A
VARTRRAYVLKRMVELEYVKPEEATRATAAPLGLVAPERRRGSGQYFLEYIQQRLEAKLGSDLVYKGGLSVYTTLNPVMQRTAEQALREGLQTLANRQASKVAGKGGTAPPVPEGAIILIEPQTGYIKALVGGTDFARSEFNRAVNARRQPGSAFKPFVYLAALEAGRTPAELLDDSPLTYTFNGRTWSPENYDDKFRGHITLQQSLEESVNVPTVRLAESIGIGRVVDAARRLGIQSPLPANLALALGAADVSLLELTAAYAALANQGARMEPVSIRYITDGQGRLIDENIPQGKDAVNPATAYVLTQMLRGAVERGTAVSAKTLGRPIAGKTGTTNDFSNAWFVGYTPTLAAGVWVGHDRVRSLGPDETGAKAALPIWIALMREVLKGHPAEDFTPPENVALARVDMLTGFLANPSCPRPVIMAFVAGTEPTQFCPVHP